MNPDLEAKIEAFLRDPCWEGIRDRVAAGIQSNADAPGLFSHYMACVSDLGWILGECSRFREELLSQPKLDASLVEQRAQLARALELSKRGVGDGPVFLHQARLDAFDRAHPEVKG